MIMTKRRKGTIGSIEAFGGAFHGRYGLRSMYLEASVQQ